MSFINYKGQLLAIDLNFSPGIAGIGFKKLIDGQKIVESIKEWYMDKIYYEI